MTIDKTLQQCRKLLTPPAGPAALTESEQILESLLCCNRDYLYRNAAHEFPSSLEPRLNEIMQRRLESEPLAYILGKAYFYNREFIITPDVLIPRPDSETLVECVLKNEKQPFCKLLDIGTGSGVLATVLAESNPGWNVFAGDISLKALKVAKKNLPEKVQTVCGDLIRHIKSRPAFDIIVSNPPYLSDIDMSETDRSVHAYEPHTALHGGSDGLDYYRRIAIEARPVLVQHGRIYCEIGYDQGNAVNAIFNECGWKEITITRDLGGRDRVVSGRKA